MASVVLQNVMKQFGHKIVLDGVSLEVRSGETVGLVGANGSGKTTLFKLVAGREQPDLGTVTRTRGLRVGYLPQEPELDSSRTLREEVGRAFDEVLDLERRMLDLSHEIAERHDDPDLPKLLADYDRLEARFHALDGHTIDVRLEEILGGLGFMPAERDLPVAALSGGQKCRAALGKLLLEDSTLLLLDEPTNHLDLEATRFLEKFLAGHHGGAVIISHDRYLLDRLAARIIEVEARSVTVYPGNYSDYMQAKELRRLTLERQVAMDRAEIEKELDYIRKYGAAKRVRQARGRRTRLERRLASGELITEGPGSQRTVNIRFGEVAPGGNTILQCEGAAKRYDDKVLFEDLSFDVYRGHRLGITGPNGTGKTTLLRMAMGEVAGDAGHIRLFENLRVGYYAQEHANFDRSGSVLDEIRAGRPDLSEHDARSYLGRFLFSGNDVFKRLADCSGGEQSRVRLARLILSNPQVLILDEPTNHLDIPSREALEAALDDYEGTIIVVSHDRFFLDQVVDRLLVLERGRHRLFLGDYSAYARQVEAEQAEAEAARIAAAAAVRKHEARKKQAKRTSNPYDGLSIEQIERLLIDRERELAGLMEQFASEAIYRDPTATRVLQEQCDAMKAEIAALDAAWHERAEEME